MKRTTYTVSSREEGRGPATVRRFSTLAELQSYVRARWEGADYIDGSRSWHNDYATFVIGGATLAELGTRGAPGTDAYWDWTWTDLSIQTANTESESKETF